MSAGHHDHHRHDHAHDHHRHAGAHTLPRPATGPALSPSLLRLGLAGRAAIAGALVTLVWVMIAGALS
ncbi:MAG: hypothetical protein R3D57_05655 [Hyphomicrobiaceae bacterium]